MTLRVEVDLKQTAITAFKAHEFEAILRQFYASVSSDLYDPGDVIASVRRQYQNAVVRADTISDAWPHIEPFIRDNDERAYVDWCQKNFYGNLWNSQADAYVRESFRKIQLSLGRKV
jgi:hypothetical protein